LLFENLAYKSVYYLDIRQVPLEVCVGFTWKTMQIVSANLLALYYLVLDLCASYGRSLDVSSIQFF